MSTWDAVAAEKAVNRRCGIGRWQTTLSLGAAASASLPRSGVGQSAEAVRCAAALPTHCCASECRQPRHRCRAGRAAWDRSTRQVQDGDVVSLS